ncbi:sensor histidine kinase [Rhodovarius lipocyclicus]|uniref:sensor histidine kinase n=1 Tax=Rhodovarius lipocyclicus TaxID=268410 RepID=UPI00135B8516|nr:HAMP domain-containing sensor histidine kinase [Rhodovarius lipocyclicus]
MRRIERLGRRLWGAAGFRLVLLYAAVFALSSAVLFGVVHWGTVGVMRGQVEQAAAADLAGLLHEQATERTSGLATVIRARIADRASHPGARYALFDAQGRRMLGDHLLAPVADGLDEVTLPGSEGEETPFIVAAATLPDGARLVVARDAGAVSEAAELLREAFLWAGAATLGLGIGGGVLVAWGFLRRIDAIAAVAEAIAAGDLARRVPLVDGGSGDEMDRLAGAINAMLDRIHHLMDELRHATSAIAHDLRTPLARLRQDLEAARDGERSVAAYDAAVEAAIAETDAILGTFAALLRIAQIESGSRRAGFAEVDLSALAAALAEAYGPSIEDSGRQPWTRIEEGVAIRGDREVLTQAIANLIENAIRHTGPGTRIGLSLSRGASGAVLRVEDDGPGVPEAERARILGRFHRLDPSRSDGGSGLGLALVAAVAVLHEAALTLDAARPDGRGLAVSLAFPPADGGRERTPRRVGMLEG